MEETQDIKNDDGMYKPSAFQKIATLFSITLPLLDALLLLAIAFTIICIVKRNNLSTQPLILLYLLPESIACCQTLGSLLCKTNGQ